MPSSALERLVKDGYLRLEEGRLCTTQRWQAAMARSALALQHAGAPWTDLRLPIVEALVEQYASLTDSEIVDLVEAILPLESAAWPFTPPAQPIGDD